MSLCRDGKWKACRILWSSASVGYPSGRRAQLKVTVTSVGCWWYSPFQYCWRRHSSECWEWYWDSVGGIVRKIVNSDDKWPKTLSHIEGGQGLCLSTHWSLCLSSRVSRTTHVCTVCCSHCYPFSAYCPLSCRSDVMVKPWLPSSTQLRKWWCGEGGTFPEAKADGEP